MPCNFDQCTGQLNPGWTAADHGEAQQGFSLSRIRREFGKLERRNHASANFECIIKRLQTWRVFRPMIIAKVTGPGTGSNNQKVVFKKLFRTLDPAIAQINSGDFAHQNRNARVFSQNMSDRRGNRRRRQTRRRDLIKQRLKHMMIGAIDQRYIDTFAIGSHVCQGFCCRQASEAAAYDDNPFGQAASPR